MKDRPITVIIAMDAAYSGPTGLALARIDGTDRGVGGAPPRYTQGPVLAGTDMQRWLGLQVAELIKPGERGLLVVESDAFGPSVARKLGIAIGVVEGLLLDIGAIAPQSRIDVASVTWRSEMGVVAKGAGRAAAKRAAVMRMTSTLAERWGIVQPLAVDEAEALFILSWALTRHSAGRLVP